MSSPSILHTATSINIQVSVCLKLNIICHINPNSAVVLAMGSECSNTTGQTWWFSPRSIYCWGQLETHGSVCGCHTDRGPGMQKTCTEQGTRVGQGDAQCWLPGSQPDLARKVPRLGKPLNARQTITSTYKALSLATHWGAFAITKSTHMYP